MKKEITRFVILAVPRSGSNMLASMLNTHPTILCHHELFNPNGIFYALHLRDTSFCLGTMEEREKAPTQFLNKVWANSRDCSHIGIKITYKQNEQAFYTLLKDSKVQKIILKRENPIKIFVSHKIAEQLNQWEVYQSKDLIKKRPKVQVDYKELSQRIAFDQAHYDEIENYLKKTNQSYHEVTFNSLFKYSEQKKILDFLHIKQGLEPLKIKSVKQNATDLSKLIENWEALIGQLKGTELEQYLF